MATKDHSREFISSIQLLWIVLGVRWKDDIWKYLIENQSCSQSLNVTHKILTGWALSSKSILACKYEWRSNKGIPKMTCCPLYLTSGSGGGCFANLQPGSSLGLSCIWQLTVLMGHKAHCQQQKARTMSETAKLLSAGHSFLNKCF